MSDRLAQLKSRYVTAEQSVRKAEEHIGRASKQRLAELMKLSPDERLARLEDPSLTVPDRAKLRRSIAASLQPRKRDLIRQKGRFTARRSRSILRSALAMAKSSALTIATAAIIAVPLGASALTAWRHTGEVMMVSRPVAVTWQLPSGKTERTILGAGDNLMVVRGPGKQITARRWIEGQGYATAVIDRHWTE